jgi:hypothetical protein
MTPRVGGSMAGEERSAGRAVNARGQAAARSEEITYGQPGAFVE